MSWLSRSEIEAANFGLAQRWERAEWQGSFDAVWETYVASKTSPCNSVRFQNLRRGVTTAKYVYLMDVVVEEHSFIKCGITRDPEGRLREQRLNFPIALWKLAKVAFAHDNSIAERCEADFIVACRHLLVEGEWIKNMTKAQTPFPWNECSKRLQNAELRNRRNNEGSYTFEQLICIGRRRLQKNEWRHVGLKCIYEIDAIMDRFGHGHVWRCS